VSSHWGRLYHELEPVPGPVGWLEAGKVRGVGPDVFEDEPLPQDSPLWTQERVVITAHYAGAFRIFLGNLRLLSRR
jgi:D-2-hydroxyacid dehydrogenase (NADP+)